jgi:hypothetical protein
MGQIETTTPTPEAAMFTLKIETGNDAMRTDADVARALRAVAAALEAQSQQARGTIRDDNGNTVGSWTFKP